MFLRKRVQKAYLSCVESPAATVIKHTVGGGVIGASAGFFWGAMRSSQLNACQFGEYILKHAVDYACVASGNPCPHYTETPNPDPLTINCFGNVTAETDLNTAATLHSNTLSMDVPYIIYSSLVGFGAGVVVGFGVGVKVAADKMREVEISEFESQSRSESMQNVEGLRVLLSVEISRGSLSEHEGDVIIYDQSSLSNSYVLFGSPKSSKSNNEALTPPASAPSPTNLVPDVVPPAYTPSLTRSGSR